MKITVNKSNSEYDHAHWETRRRFLRFLLKTIGFPLLIKVDQVDGLENIPKDGPALFLMNHVSFADSIVVLHVCPRYIIPLAKREVYNYPVVGIFPRMWGVVSIKRDEIDRRAIRHALAVLRAGEILLVAPEGTRSPELQPGREGIAYLASRTGASIVPVALDETDGFPAFRLSRRWRQSGVHISFGRPFRFRSDLQRARGKDLRPMTDEAMYVLSALLPEHRRGVYADLSKATQETIEWV